MKRLSQTIVCALLLCNSVQVTAQLNLNWQEIGPSNLGGIIYALVIDQRDASRQTLYAAAYGGGIWKTTNGGNNWFYLGCTGNFAASCIIQTSDGRIIFGTGGGENYINSSSSLRFDHIGNGIYVIDSVDHVTHIPSTQAIGTNSPWARVKRIASHPNQSNKLIAATQKGLYRSVDYGLTWDSISIAGVTTMQGAVDVKWSSDGQTIIAAVGGGADIVRSLDGGVNWGKITNNPGLPLNHGRTEIAFAPHKPNLIYLSIATTAGATLGVYKSTDNGNTWSTVVTKSNSFDPFGLNNQGWYTNAMAVLPQQPDSIFVGGAEMYAVSGSTGPLLLSSFSDPQITPGENIYPYSYAINDINPNEMYVASSRGVFKTTNAVSAFTNPTFYSANNGLSARDFFSVAASINGFVMGSTNFRGTYISNNASPYFSRLNYDLAFCEFSQLNTNYLFTENFFGQLHISTDNGISFQSAFDTNIDPQGYQDPSRCGGAQSQNAQFINPFLLHETDIAYGTIDSVSFQANTSYAAGDTIVAYSNTANTPFQFALTGNLQPGETLQVPDPVKSRLFLATHCGIWMKRNALSTATSPDWFKISKPFSGNVLCFALTQNGNTLYAGTSSGTVIKISGLNTTTFSGILADSITQTIDTLTLNDPIEGIATDPNNPNIIIATKAGNSAQPNFYKSINSGFTWAPSVISVSSLPVYTCVIDAANSNNYLVGTESGIWSSADAGTSWQADNQNLCNVPVYRLRQFPLFEKSCPVIYAATSSRGLWRTFTLTPSNCNTSTGIIESTNPTGNSKLLIHPNPATSEIQVDINLRYAQPVYFTISDITGRTISNNHTYLPAGKQILQINNLSFLPGIYILTVQLNNTVQSSRIVITQ